MKKNEKMRVAVYNKNGVFMLQFLVYPMEATQYNLQTDVGVVDGEACWVCSLVEMSRFLNCLMEARA